jgi:hypothetical protein
MFEALRGLRDAVAPESGNLGAAAGGGGGNANNNSNEGGSGEPDMEELWHLYRSGDAVIVELIQNEVGKGPAGGAGTAGTAAMPQKREDFIRLYAKMEMEKDTELVMKLASTVLEKSAQIDRRVESLPGMDRNRTKQMEKIEELIELNRLASQELETSYRVARQRRDSCRAFIMDSTCRALGIDEEQDS